MSFSICLFGRRSCYINLAFYWTEVVASRHSVTKWHFWWVRFWIATACMKRWLRVASNWLSCIKKLCFYISIWCFSSPNVFFSSIRIKNCPCQVHHAICYAFDNIYVQDDLFPIVIKTFHSLYTMWISAIDMKIWLRHLLHGNDPRNVFGWRLDSS